MSKDDKKKVKTNPLALNSIDLRENLIDVMKVGLVSLVEGSPGIGKSDIMKSIAEEFNWKLIDMRLSQCDPTDLKK